VAEFQVASESNSRNRALVSNCLVDSVSNGPAWQHITSYHLVNDLQMKLLVADRNEYGDWQ
jgi:hypothetical protein